ncbi:MAG: hypothetical protein WBG76_17415, partial [Ornithinimicrobium sp.]
ALSSVHIAQAGLSISFELTPWYDSRDQGFRLYGLFLESTGANVYIHGVRLDSYGWFAAPPSEDGSEGEVQEIAEPLDLDVGVSAPLVPVDELSLPKLLHSGERVSFGLRSGSQVHHLGSSVSALGVTIKYSLDGGSETRSRYLDWVDPEF